MTIEVSGFRDAVYVAPEGERPERRPVTIVLHGNYDRPEWQCETWLHVAAFHGWVLCPRGVPTPWAEKSADRWMYRGADKTAKEIDTALDALQAKYKGCIDTSNMVLAGFSLGAILAPSIAISNPNRYSTLFLIEGGIDRLDRRRIRALKSAGVRAMGLAMSSPKYREVAKRALPRLKRNGIRAEYVDMAGAGHNYRSDFTTAGREALMRLLTTRVSLDTKAD